MDNYPSYIKAVNPNSKGITLQPLSTEIIAYSFILESNPKDSEIKMGPSVFKTENNNLFASNSDIIIIKGISPIKYPLIIGVIVLIFVISRSIRKYIKNGIKIKK